MLGARLKELRKENHITQAMLADKLGITQQAVGKWETSRSSPDPHTLLQLAEIFNVSIDSLLGRQNTRVGEVLPYAPSETVSIPVIGTVRAGYGSLAYEDDYGTQSANVRNPDNYFYLIVRGDSMEPRIKDGDLALVHKQPVLDDGDLGVVVYGDSEGTLKRFFRKGNAVVLQPFNPTYDSLLLSGEELDHLYIAGKVIETKAQW